VAVVRASPPRPRAAPGPYPDDQGGYDPPYRDERGYRRAPSIQGPSTGLQLGLGIASLSVGALGLLIVWIPLLGMWAWPLGALGILLGLIGLIIAITKSGAGFGFPIAGAGVSLVTLSIALYWMFVVRAALDAPFDMARRAARREFPDQFAEIWKQEMQKALENFPKNLDKGGFPPDFFNKDKVGFDPPDKRPPTNPIGHLQIAGGKGEVASELAQTDPRDRMRTNSFCRVWTVNLTAGRTYQFDMIAGFDSWLRLEDENGMNLAQDDDSGGNRNARLTFPIQRTGTYRIVATSCFPMSAGNFTLRVEER
jgi:hypothetical protein